MNRLQRSAASLTILLAALLALPGCAPMSSNPDGSSATADEAAVRTAGERWNAAYKAMDIDALVALYAEDAVLMPETAQVAKGPTAIREFLKVHASLLADFEYSPVAGNTVDIEVSGNLGFRSGIYEVTDKSGTSVDTGKWLEIWRKTDGQWFIIRDIWNSNTLPMFPPYAYTAGSIPAE